MGLPDLPKVRQASHLSGALTGMSQHGEEQPGEQSDHGEHDQQLHQREATEPWPLAGRAVFPDRAVRRRIAHRMERRSPHVWTSFQPISPLRDTSSAVLPSSSLKTL
jgi:hypothetical protein